MYIIPDRLPTKDAARGAYVEDVNSMKYRFKTVTAFGPHIGSDESALRSAKSSMSGEQFQEASGDMHVKDHMTRLFGFEHSFELEKSAVNVGTEDEPQWYPQEFLRILPYQEHNHLLPERFSQDLLDFERIEPNEHRARIESEGLKGLGVIQANGKQPFVSLGCCSFWM